MPIFRVNFRSEVLGQALDVNVVLPDTFNQKTPILFLLHGRSDDCNAWLTNTSLARYANESGFMVVMPEVRLSYYADEYMGANYWTFLTQEVTALIYKWFNVSPKNKKFVAGLSMGGYGAFKWALNQEEWFTGAASLSGAVDVYSLWKKDKNRNPEFSRVFKSKREFSKSTNDIVHLVKSNNYEKCYFLQMCGTEDFLYEDNVKYNKIATKNIANFEYLEHPGDHNWEYWDMAIQIVFDRFKKLV